MRIIIIDFISLDGVVQSPGGQGEDPDGGFRHGGWSGPYFDEDAMGSVIGEVMDQSEALLFGLRTWDVMASAWPDRAGDPFANQMNAIAKYVVSRTLTAEQASSRWNKTTLIGGDDAIGAIRQLRDRDGDDAIQVWAARRSPSSSSRTTWSTSTA